MKNDFAKIIKLLRKERKLRQIDLAERLDTTQRKVSYWEAGKVEPDIDTLWQIADLFEISVDELIGRE